MREILSYTIDLGFYAIQLSQIINLALLVLGAVIVYSWSRRILRQYIDRHDLDQSEKIKIKRLLFWSVLLLVAAVSLLILRIDPDLLPHQHGSITGSKVLLSIFIILLARIADYIISHRLEEEVEGRQIERDPFSVEVNSHHGARIVQYIIFTIVALLMMRNFGINSYSFGSWTVEGQQISITIEKVIIGILIILITRLIVWLLTNFALQGFYKRKAIDVGKQYAYNQLFSYLIFFFGIIIALQNVGINMTLMWTGAAALLVGIGIALQQTISDFFSGLVLLFERSVQVGDFLEVGEQKGKLLKIGLRSSILETREMKVITIPNSQLVNDNVTNWSSLENYARFQIDVGVAYGSDTELVKKLLLQALEGNKSIYKSPKPFVRFVNFGDSSLDFSLFFFSRNFLGIEDVKSDVRLRVDQLFREHDINIPFPQRDIWIKESGK